MRSHVLKSIANFHTLSLFYLKTKTQLSQEEGGSQCRRKEASTPLHSGYVDSQQFWSNVLFPADYPQTLIQKGAQCQGMIWVTVFGTDVYVCLGEGLWHLPRFGLIAQSI